MKNCVCIADEANEEDANEDKKIQINPSQKCQETFLDHCTTKMCFH